MELEKNTSINPVDRKPKNYTKRMRNLPQYAKLTDDEFEEVLAKKKVGVVKSQEFEDRIKRKIDDISRDYDLEDLNSNDLLTLRALAQAYINLEDYEDYEYELRKEGIEEKAIFALEKLANMKNTLRTSISSMSGDLKITRKVRVADKDQSVISYIEDLKKKAKEFYEAKMMLVFCPKCNTWIGSIWSLFPYEKGNKITLVCNKELEGGEVCGEKVIIYTSDLIKSKGTNNQNIPQSII